MGESLLNALLSGLLIAAYVFSWRSRQRFNQIIIWLAILILTVLLIDRMLAASQLWDAYANDPWRKFWLPPHSSVVYDHIWRLFRSVVVSVVCASVVFTLLSSGKRWLKLQHYGHDDVALLSVAALVSGWPGIFLTLAAIFTVAVMFSVIRAIIKRRVGSDNRLIITPFVLPVTAIMFWFLPYLNHLTGLDKIRF